ncbi:MAG TPA: hypothetical protein VH415_17205 [Nitrososphaeraceae archaeon]|jgi:hypothetical protein
MDSITSTTILIISISLLIPFGPVGIPSLFYEWTFIQSGYGDGFSNETLPPFSVNGQDLVLTTKVSPSILTPEDRQDRFIEISIFDYNTEEVIQNTSFLVTLYKDDRVIMNGNFHSDPGPLKIRIKDAGNDHGRANSTFDSSKIWSTKTGNITIQGPVLLEAGLYRLSINLQSLGTRADNITLPSTGLAFNSWLSVADVKNNMVASDNKNYNVTIISYYDRIINSTFSPEIKTVSWTMPFNWNLSRINHQNILIHEEVKLPRLLFNASPFDLVAFLNGKPLTGRSVTIDPYSSVNNTIVHLLMNKQSLADLMKNRTSNLGNSTMSFKVEQMTSHEQLSSTDLVTDNGQAGITLDSIPKQLTANSKSIITLSFKDPDTDKPIAADVTYSLEILDNNGNPIFKQSNQTLLHDAEGRLELVFPERGIYQIRILIESIAPLDSEIADTTTSVARGYLLVK